MDRLELGIVAVLAALVVQMWMLWDLPGQIERRESHSITPPALAEESK